MGYKYFAINDVSLNDWQKVFEYCLKKSDFFCIPHILNYENLNQDIRRQFDVNNVKTEELWNFDYHNFGTDDIDILQKLYKYTLTKSDFMYLSMPANIEFKDYIQDGSAINIKNVIRDEKDYYEISGPINEDCKKHLLDIGLFDFMQHINDEWRFRLIISLFGYSIFDAVQNYMGSLLTGEDLKHFEGDSILLREKFLSNICVYGEMREELFDILFDMFSLSITRPYELGKPFFTNVILNKEEKQMLYFSVDTLFVCLSDLEIQELIDNYQIDITSWKLEQQKSIYQAPMDYFSLTAYDLW